MAKADSIRGTRSKVLMIDDDPSLLRSLARLVRVSGYEVRTFSRPSALLADDLPSAHACMVVDVNLPEMSGVELYETPARSGRDLPVIVITVEMTSRPKRLRSGCQRLPFCANLLKAVFCSRLSRGRLLDRPN
jgi:CheY-like chemotaxis protein